MKDLYLEKKIQLILLSVVFHAHLKYASRKYISYILHLL